MRVKNPEFQKVILEMSVQELEADEGILEKWVQNEQIKHEFFFSFNTFPHSLCKYPVDEGRE